MSLNKSKCGIINYSDTRISLTAVEKTQNNILGIPIVDKYKYLGITINKKLHPDSYLQQL